MRVRGWGLGLGLWVSVSRTLAITQTLTRRERRALLGLIVTAQPAAAKVHRAAALPGLGGEADAIGRSALLLRVRGLGEG